MTLPGRWKMLLSGAAILASCYPLWSAESLPLDEQPFPDSQVYADAARNLANGRGYVTMIDERKGPNQSLEVGQETFPPRYPFGTSVALSPFVRLMGNDPSSVAIGAKSFAVLYLLVVAAAAWAIGGPAAAAVAAACVGFSPFAEGMSARVLSDALAGTLALLPLFALMRESKLSAFFAGASAGALVDVRFLGVAVLLAVLISIGSGRRLIAFAGAFPFIAALLIYQSFTFGNPLMTGYDFWLPGLPFFDLDNIMKASISSEGPYVIPDALNGRLFGWLCPCPSGGPMSALPNVMFYPAVLLGLFWIYAPPLVTGIGLMEVARTRTERKAIFVISANVLTLLILMPYFYQASRLLSPAVTLCLPFGATRLVGFVSRFKRRIHFEGVTESQSPG